MASRRNVYVVEEDSAQRRELVAFNQAKGMVPRPYVSVEEFLQEAQHLEPGCVILGKLSPPDATGVVEAISKNLDPSPIIMIAVPGSVLSAIQTVKPTGHDVLERPFEENTVYELLSWLFADLDQDLQLTNEIIAARKLVRALSGREFEVLRGLVGGMSNKAIASHLGLNVRTVEMHRGNMMKRLNVHTISAALRIAFYAKISSLSLEADRRSTIVLLPAT